ncbi:hypothetical protein BB559_001781 [Furculomyces boomerangus]|uniref:Uncharacterized protein n=2 Tax=Harpellales TaxID=61421 RepID=A0A2T9Z0N1_9FUNG|nr:hypothetical protein BB559_001781 [Furculomyces boomerangus]PWA02896.1 hypothetical protein BB558_000952 [Smittium angustum]
MSHSDSWVTEAAKFSLIGGGLGLLTSALQNSLQTHNAGAIGVLSRTGSTIGYFAVMGGVFAGTRGLSADLRGKHDHWNTAAAGCLAGFIAGIRKRSIPAGIGACVFMGGALGTYEYLGGINGKIAELSPEEREKVKKSFLVPSEPSQN